MKTRRLLIASFVFLAIGIGLIAGYCNGTAGFSTGYPFSGSSLKFDITTTGVPAIAGLLSTAMGLVLLIVSTIAAIVAEIRAPRIKSKKPDYESLAKSSETPLP